MILVDDHNEWTPDWPLFLTLSRDSPDPRPPRFDRDFVGVVYFTLVMARHDTWCLPIINAL